MEVIKSVEFPNRTFNTKGELFTALKKHKDTIVQLKKAARVSDNTKASIPQDVEKEIIKGIDVRDGHSLHVINTTKILDSHRDLHINGLWSKSIKEQRGKIFFLVNHDMGVGSVVAYPKDVKMRAINVSFKDLGVDYDGDTQALVFEVANDKIRHTEAKHIIDNNIEIEHSIRMSYVKIELAINSDDADNKAEKQIWDKYYPVVANKEDADEVGYMWVVKEAKIISEGSMVLKGSNFVTPMIKSTDDNDNDEQDITEEIKEIKEKGSNPYPFLV